MTEILILQIQQSKMIYLCRIVGLTLRERVRSSDFQKVHGVGQLLLCNENQFRLNCVSRMPPFYLDTSNLEDSGGTCWRDCLIWFGNALGPTKKDLEDIVKEKDI